MLRQWPEFVPLSLWSPTQRSNQLSYLPTPKSPCVSIGADNQLGGRERRRRECRWLDWLHWSPISGLRSNLHFPMCNNSRRRVWGGVWGGVCVSIGACNYWIMFFNYHIPLLRVGILYDLTLLSTPSPTWPAICFSFLNLTLLRWVSFYVYALSLRDAYSMHSRSLLASHVRLCLLCVYLF